MNNKIRVKCINTGTTELIPKGTTLIQTLKMFSVEMKNPVVGALVNNVSEDLSFELFHPKTLQFIDIVHPDGMRMYTRSLSFILCKAFFDLFPSLKLRIDHSIARGIFCVVRGEQNELKDPEVEKIRQRMQELIDLDLPFIPMEEETEFVIREFEKNSLDDKISLLKHAGQYYANYYKIDNYLNFFYGPMVPSTGYLKVFDLNKFYDGMLLRIPRQNDPSRLEEMINQDKMFEIFHEFTRWNKILKVDNFSQLNAAISNGKPETLIKVSEALHEKKIGEIADKITSGKNNIRIILISGPSSSGKTTFGKRLAIQLMVNGIRPINLSLDQYFLDRDKTPTDEFGQLDFEALEALDVELFNQNLTGLLGGQKIEVPKFSFVTGKRFFDGQTLQMNRDNAIIIEGIHGLNPQLTYRIPAENIFRIYISALTSLNIDEHNPVKTTDNRLIRRIVRDNRYRKYSATETISRWQSVRRGEEKNIFPFQEEADIMFNSALIYELPVLKPLVEPLLMDVKPNQPEYSEAMRLLRFLKYLRPLGKKEIPPTSILREFLGGSSFIY